MTDLNLDGLPLLQALRDTSAPAPRTTLTHVFAEPAASEELIRELRQLVERERIEQARGDLAEINRAAERLPAWAKPVMREAEAVSKELDELDSQLDCPIDHSKLHDALLGLTEAQLKEIGEDDG